MSDGGGTSFLKHARTFAGLTLVSRVLGLVRDAVIVRILGVSGLGTAFGIAFQFPNTFRRLFGEGALSASLIPEYAGLLKNDPTLAHRFASLTVGVMAAGLGGVVLVLELGLLALLWLADVPEDGRRALVLLAAMLPYMPLVCITAALGGMLQTHGRFAAQAGAPIILNLCMIVAAAGSAYALGAPAETVALAVAAAVSLAGVLQVLWCLRDLRGTVHWTRDLEGAAVPARRMFRRMVPVVLGLGTIQIATLIESWVIVAWPLYQGPTISGHPYPLDEAAGAALYNAQRLYQFPLGIFGIALATAVFPTLARLADEPAAFAATLRRSIRLALFMGVPATLGLIWVSRDLTAVVYQGGAVDAEDTRRMAECLGMYAPLVGTYSLTHVLTRAFYARGDTSLPTRISIATVVLGLVLGTSLMWILRERGLALGGSLAAVVQIVWLVRAADARLGGGPAGPIFNAGTLGALARIGACGGVMLLALAGFSLLWPHEEGVSVAAHAVRLSADVMAGGAAYLGATALLCREDLRTLLNRSPRRAPISPS
ncbi:MAG: murein biosynthesis integral membrane protein MurJ [Planctomycetota bacterium]|nr:murein biosynthesis integral membrane protein MurJ [Planctomycetota bacterium]